MKKEELEKLIEDTFFNKRDKIPSISLATGRGGMKEMLKSICERLGIEYNWRGMRKAYRFLLYSGGVERYKGSYYFKIDSYYI